MTTDGKQVSALPKQRVWDDYFEAQHTAYNSMRQAYKLRASQGNNQDTLAARLGIDKGLISRRLKGEENMTLKIMSAMASAMDCRVFVEFRPIEEIGRSNFYEGPGWGTGTASPPPLRLKEDGTGSK